MSVFKHFEDINNYPDYKLICDINNLQKSYESVRRSSSWKQSTQIYASNYIYNISELSNKLYNETYRPTPPHNFITFERGKERLIESACMDDKIVQDCLCRQVLIPKIRPYLIYDNSASLEGKGVSFFRHRLDHHIRSFVGKHGVDGYILMIDFSKFFGNIQHAKLLDMFGKVIDDAKVMHLILLFLMQYKVDVSYLSDDEYNNCLNTLFNSIEYNKIDESLKTGEKFMYKSIGIGNQISQISGLLYPHQIDNYCKIVKGCKYYGRYMDDIYIIHESKDFLWELFSNIQNIAKEIGLFINERKTQMVKLSHPFTILKTKYIIYPDGSVYHIPNKDIFKREKTKLHKQRERLEQGLTSIEEIEREFRSWKGTVEKFDNRQSIINIEHLYNELFINNNNQGGII